MTQTPDIRKNHLYIILDVLRKNLPQNAEVWVFGSRAKWSAKEFSDLDLAIDIGRSLKLDELVGIRSDFEESNLPYKVDIVDWHAVDAKFKSIIEKDKISLPEFSDSNKVSKKTNNKWKSGKLGDLIEFQRGFDLPKQDRSIGNIPIVSSSGISGYHSEAKVNPPGVVTGRYGTIGKVFYLEEPYWPLNTTLWVKDFKNNDPKFVYYFLQTVDFRSCVDKSSVPGVNRNDLHLIPVRIPDRKNQIAIAEILTAIDNKIELNRQMNETLEGVAHAFFKSWFVDFDPVRAKMEGRKPEGLSDEIAALFPDKLVDSARGNIPDKWKVGSIADCCEKIINGSTPSRKNTDYWLNGTIPWLTSGEVRQKLILKPENHITELGLKNSSARWLPSYSTVVALYGATAGQVSFIASKLTTNQAVCGLIPKQYYRFYNYLHLSSCVRELERQARGSAQQNLSKGIVENTKILLPKPHLIQHFDRMLEPLFDKWVANLIGNKILSQIRDTLLPKLISGELRVDKTELAA